MNAAEIAAALGGGCRSGAWWRCRCPVQHHRSAGPVPIGGDAAQAETLMAAEGIETAQPARVALSTSGIAALVLPPLRRVQSIGNAGDVAA